MQQLNHIAENGEIHHYKIDGGLFLLLHHAEMQPEHRDAALALRETMAAMPDKPTCVDVAQQALALLSQLRSSLSGPTYSAIYGHLHAGMHDAST